MKSSKLCATALAWVFLLTACSTTNTNSSQDPDPAKSDELPEDAVEILLSDGEIQVNGSPADADTEDAVYLGHDIVYYEAGQDFTYGEGNETDAHSAEEASEHTVVHITQPGTYSINGILSKGQIAIDLGEDAENDPRAVVTLILNGIDITCDVAPAVIFYDVYECGSTDTATKDIDTSSAGANVIIADGTTNTVNGSYVARIYKPDSVVLNESGTEVEDAKKLHKYDGAFYSKMSMNVSGGKENTGILTINAANEGMDSELHLTINGGIIHINSGNDGINTNEDGVSVTTVNGGKLYIKVNGETGEGDGIDSNGWLVINGGTVTAQACSFSGDAGIDFDMGIHINGGEVIATGHMLDRIEDGGQNYAVFTFAQKQSGSHTIRLKSLSGNSILEASPDNDYSILVYSSPNLTEGVYTLWRNNAQLSGQSGGMMGGPGMQGMPGMMPDGAVPPIAPEGPGPNGATPPDPPQGNAPPAGMERPEMGEPGDKPDRPWRPDNGNEDLPQELTTEFRIADGGNMFQVIF